MPLYTSEVSVDNTPLPVTVATALPAGTNVLGHVITDSGSTTSISNASIAVTQSTSPWVVSLASTTITGTVTAVGNLTHNNAAPAATNIGVLPAVASTAVPTYTAGDQVLLSTDLNGNLRVTIDATSSEQNVNLNQVGGTTIALGQTTMSASLPVTIASNQSALPVTLTSTTITGTVAVTQSTSPWVVSGTVTANAGTGTFAISAASLPLPTGAATSALQSNVQSAPGTSASTAITIQGSASGVAIPISGSITAAPATVSSATVSRVATSSTSTTLLASRAARINAVIFCENGPLYVLAGSGTASATNYTWRLTTNTELDITNYTGAVTAALATGTGNVQVSDF